LAQLDNPAAAPVSASAESAHLPLMSAPLSAIERSPITLLHIAIMAVCACGFAVDLVEMALGGVLSAVFTARPYTLDPSRLTWLLTSTYVGAMIGASLLGWVADRVGPKKVLSILACWIGVWSVLSAGARTADELAIIRLLSGIGLGAYPPVMIAYLTDIAPPDRRGVMIFSTCASAYLAPPFAIFAVRWLTPIAPFGVAGWRWPFAVAGVVALFGGLAMAGLPEAPHWLAAAGRGSSLQRVAERMRRSRTVHRFVRLRQPAPPRRKGPPGRASLRQAANGSPSKRLLILSVISFTVPIATVSFPLLTGPILLARHFTLSDTLFYIGLATFGPIIGTFVGGVYVDRLGRRGFLMICAGAMLASAALFLFVEATGVMAASLVGFAVFTSLYVPTMTVYGAELFTASTRARGISIAWAANRLAAAGAPAILVPLVHQQATIAIAAVLAIALMANILVVAFLAPRETDAQRYPVDAKSDGVTMKIVAA
jgi:putative MFS transporter